MQGCQHRKVNCPPLNGAGDYRIGAKPGNLGINCHAGAIESGKNYAGLINFPDSLRYDDHKA